MFSCALVNAVFIPNCGFIYWSSALYRHFPSSCSDFSQWPSSSECSAPNVWYCKKGTPSQFTGLLLWPYFIFLPSKRKEWIRKITIRRMYPGTWNYFFRLNLLFYDYSLSLVIIPQMSRQFQLLKMKTDLLYFLFFFFSCSHSYGYCWRVAAVYQQIVDV